MNNHQYLILEIIKAVLLFALSFVLLWLATWFINLAQWFMSFTIGGIWNQLVSTRPYSVWQFVTDVISMGTFALIFGSGLFLVYAKPWYLRNISLFLFGLCIIAIYDPVIKDYLPMQIHDIIETLQTNYHYRLVGGPNIWDSKMTQEFSRLQYILFDVIVGIFSIAMGFNRDKEDLIWES